MSDLLKVKKYNAVLCTTLFKEKISLLLIAELCYDWKDKYKIQVTRKNKTLHSTISLVFLVLVSCEKGFYKGFYQYSIILWLWQDIISVR